MGVAGTMPVVTLVVNHVWGFWEGITVEMCVVVVVDVLLDSGEGCRRCHCRFSVRMNRGSFLVINVVKFCSARLTQVSLEFNDCFKNACTSLHVSKAWSHSECR